MWRYGLALRRHEDSIGSNRYHSTRTHGSPAMNMPAMHAAIDQDDFFAEVLANPEARAAFDDAQARDSLVDALVALRHALGLTQTEVARRMGVKQPMVSGFENEGSDPRLSTIQRYARAVRATAAFRLIRHAH